MLDITIHACIEYEELKGLIHYLKTIVPLFNIIVVLDRNNTNENMIKLVKQSDVEYYLHPLVSFKENTNFIHNLCKNKYILELCVDEVPTIPLLVQCLGIFNKNPQFDAIAIPRINVFSNLTTDNAENMYVGNRGKGYLLKEPINEHGWHHWPDYQIRLIKNVPHIHYGSETHSGLVGCRNVGYLPQDPSLSILHVKTVAHQERILKLYDKINPE